MAIIKCPECGKEISDKAEMCVSCGFPISDAVRIELNIMSIEEQLVYAKKLLDKKEYDKAYEIYIKLANQGVGEAEYKIFELCDKRYGCQSFENNTGLTGYEWLERAVEHNVISATYDLAIIYYWGIGLEKNLEKALELYKKAYENDIKDAWFWVGECYEELKDYGNALEVYEKSLAKGEIGVYKKIGRLYEYGHGVERNENIAIEYYKKGAAAGDSAAKRKLSEIGNIYGNHVKPEITCPTCGSKNVSKISALSRGASIWAWGAFSNKINKTFKCENCGYTW